MTDAHPTYTVQVVIDCADPHPLADWWAEVLGWQVEPQDEEFIRSMVDQGLASEADTTRHHDKLVWATGAAILHPDGTDRAPRILFVQVPEPKTVKNRVHLDLRSNAEPSEAERERLLGLGATEMWSASQGPHTWVVLGDPEGNELCLPVPRPV
jgi:glyoxalase superfamily protein